MIDNEKEKEKRNEEKERMIDKWKYENLWKSVIAQPFLENSEQDFPDLWLHILTEHLNIDIYRCLLLFLDSTDALSFCLFFFVFFFESRFFLVLGLCMYVCVCV